MKPKRRRGKNIVKFWQELRPVEQQMTRAEKEWFADFIKAYYLRNLEALMKLTQDPELFAAVRKESIWMSHEARRSKQTSSRAYGNTYTELDWFESRSSCHSLELAIIEKLDFERENSRKKSPEG